MKKFLGALAPVALFVGIANAGVVYEIEVTDHEQSPAKTESIQLVAEGNSLKMGISPGEGEAQGNMIFRGERPEMVMVDHDDKSYTVLDEEAISRIAGQVEAAKLQMQEALKRVPEEQRARIEEMMKQRMPGSYPPPQQSAIEHKKTTDKATRNGYPCTRYEVYRGGRQIRELWVTEWHNVEGGNEVQETFEQMAGFFRKMTDTLSGPNPMMHAGPTFFESLKQIDGFPVITTDFDGNGNKESHSELRSTRRQSLQPSAFEPPAGYKRRSMVP